MFYIEVRYVNEERDFGCFAVVSKSNPELDLFRIQFGRNGEHDYAECSKRACAFVSHLNGGSFPYFMNIQNTKGI